MDILLRLFSPDQINSVLADPRTVATLLGALVSISGAILGTFLLLRGMSLTTDAISHTILLGIVVAFLIMVFVFNAEPDLSSPWLILGAAAAGVGTVVLTEALQRTGLIKADAALGLVFPFLFALSILLIARFADNVHLDADSVVVGEIGVAWANTSSICLEDCAEVVITPDSPLARVGRICVNCAAEGISPRSAQAVFEEDCANCGTYSAAQAYAGGLIDKAPILLLIPRALMVMAGITLLNLIVVIALYKELKLATFDFALAKALGLRPGMLYYLLMILVSVTAVGAFDAVGSILVVAFFIIPPATAYLLTRRLWTMLALAPLFGVLAAVTGYDLARGSFLGLFSLEPILVWLDGVIGLQGYTTWNVSISASMVLMMFVFLLIAWAISPTQGWVAALYRRVTQRARFAEQVVLGHLLNHQATPEAVSECAVETLHEHLHWPPARTSQVLGRLRAQNQVKVERGIARLTERGLRRYADFGL